MTISDPPRVLAVCSFFPVPADRGDPIRVGMYLRSLNKTADLTVYAVRRADTTADLVRELQRQLPGAYVVTFDPPRIGTSRLAKLQQWVKAVITGTPVWILNRYSSELDAVLRQTAQAFDVVVFLGEAASTYSLRCRSAFKHVDKANVLSRSTARDVSLATGPLLKARLRGIARLSKRFEKRVLESVHSVGVTSTEEAVRLEADYARIADMILPSAIAVTTRPGPFNPGGNYVLWLGSLDYRSNIVGLQRFLAEGLPVLQEAGLTLVVAGSGTDPHLAGQLQSIPGVHYRGYVPDLSSLAEGARAAVIPLWSGAGVKLKTLTLMDVGLPVAATTVAMEGIDVAAALAVTDDCRVLAERIVAASAGELTRARERGLTTVRESFSSESFALRVTTWLEEHAPARTWEPR
jgi:polysaccharide biosynthesis protein PslH